jgi:hypothetical protein
LFQRFELAREKFPGSCAAQGPACISVDFHVWFWMVRMLSPQPLDVQHAKFDQYILMAARL